MDWLTLTAIIIVAACATDTLKFYIRMRSENPKGWNDDD